MFIFRVRRRSKPRPRRKLPVTPEVEALRRLAKEQLPVRVAQLAREYGFEYNSVRIKHNVSNWGSCSSKGNINLNLNLMRLPERLRDYVIKHELCHLKEMNHGPKFKAMLTEICPDWQECRAEMKTYKLI